MPISKPKEILNYYQKDNIAKGYITKRFTEPLNVVEHKKQVSTLNRIIKLKGVNKVLEFAPGPARVTSELIIENGTSIDSSESMLKIAKERMSLKGKKWNFKQADILNLNIKEKFELIFCFRFLLHFKKEMRSKIYQQARKSLKREGYLVFEAMNHDVVKPLRKILGVKRYFVYDKLYQRKKLIQELEENGFRVIKLFPILNHFWLQTILSRPFKILRMKRQSESIINFLESYKSNQPYEWVVLCQKK